MVGEAIYNDTEVCILLLETGHPSFCSLKQKQIIQKVQDLFARGMSLHTELRMAA